MASERIASHDGTTRDTRRLHRGSPLNHDLVQQRPMLRSSPNGFAALSLRPTMRSHLATQLRKNKASCRTSSRRLRSVSCVVVSVASSSFVAIPFLSVKLVQILRRDDARPIGFYSPLLRLWTYIQRFIEDEGNSRHFDCLLLSLFSDTMKQIRRCLCSFFLFGCCCYCCWFGFGYYCSSEYA